MFLVLVLLFTVRGFHRGLLRQVAETVGVVLAIWAGAAISQWLGARWTGAQPAMAFWALRWLVILLGALAVASVFKALGRAAADWIGGTPLRWVDRACGLAAGAVIGGALVCLLLLAVLSAPGPGWLVRPAGEAACARPVLRAGASACGLARRLPEARRVRTRLLAAERRVIGGGSSI